jgi:tetratricopeptide (TPR) repeat protein
MLDRKGNRIDRRNPQDIFVPLYNKQIPPGAGQVVHFALEVPRGATGPITLEAKVNYRKFDRTYLDYIYGKGKGPKLPVVVMARDQVKLGIDGGTPAANEPSPIQPVWQRWNDYGIGLLLEGGNTGGQKGELKQAEPVFQKVAELGAADGWVNLGRVYQKEGRIPEALAALEKAAKHEKPAAPWVINWLSGQINARNGAFDEAIESFQSVLDTRIPNRKIDLSLDYEVNNELAFALYARAMQENSSSPDRLSYLKKAVAAYRRTLSIDSENITAHHALGLAYGAAPWGANRVTTANEEQPDEQTNKSEPLDADSLVKLAESAVDLKAPEATRSRAAGRLPREIARFVDGPRPRYQSRLAPLFELVEILSPAWDKEESGEIFRSLTRALEVTHERLHERLKPDETAEGQVFAIARKNLAADANAQSIVIHSLHRPGAPGLEEPAMPASTTPGATATTITSTAQLGRPSPAVARESSE